MPYLNGGLMHYLDPTDGLKNLGRPTVDLTTVYDCTGANVGAFKVPPGVLLAGYATGSGEVPWTPAQFSRFPGAIRIDQSPADSPAEPTADAIDMEAGAVRLDQLAPRIHDMRASYAAGTRPGQREPMVYCQRSNVTPVVNTLIAAGITSGVYLWVAEQMKAKDAASILEQASGPFPEVGIQYEFDTDHDVSLFSTAYLNRVSGSTTVSKPGPGTQVGIKICRKCKGLFYGPEESTSMCPVGAQHDGSQSHTFKLDFVV